MDEVQMTEEQRKKLEMAIEEFNRDNEKIAVNEKINYEREAEVKREVEEYVEFLSENEKGKLKISEVGEAWKLSSVGERQRIEYKRRMLNFLRENRDLTMGDEEMEDLFLETEKYITMNVTASSKESEFEREKKVLRNIQYKLGKYQKTLDEEAREPGHETLTDYARQRVIVNLTSYIESLEEGELEGPISEQVIEKTDNVERLREINHQGPIPIRIDVSTPTTSKSKVNLPLFQHEPCANDLAQGYLGDCYLVSALAGIADKHPEKIREMIKDNGDGTATVRLFQVSKSGNANSSDVFTPVFVTVDKVPSWNSKFGQSEYAENCNWVKIFERAYAATGLNNLAKTEHVEAAEKDLKSDELGKDSAKLGYNKYTHAVPADINEKYEQLKNGQRTLDQGDDLIHWLVDKKKNLKKWNPSTEDIEGGSTVGIMNAVLGPDCTVGQYYVPSESFFWEEDMTLKETGYIRWIANVLEKEKPGFQMDAIGPGYKNYERIGIAILYNKVTTSEEGCKFIFAAEEQGMNYSAKVLQDCYQKVGEIIRDSDNISPEVVSNEIDKLSSDWDGNLGKERSEKLRNMVKRFWANNLEEIAKEKEFLKQGEPYSGVYSGKELTVAQKITEATDLGYSCTASMFLAREKVKTGLLNDHSYTVLTTVKKEVLGKELTFVRLRNPHAQNIMEYKVSDNGLALESKEAQAKDSEGYFDVELSDFVSSIKSLDFAKKSFRAKEAEEIKENAKIEKARSLGEIDKTVAQKLIDESTSRYAYDKVLDDIARGLRKSHGYFSKDSAEFLSMEEAVLEARKSMTKGVGDDEKEKMKKNFENLRNKTMAYLAHCEKKAKFGSRREKRVNIAEAIIELLEMREKGVINPTLEIKNRLLDTTIDTIRKVASQSKQSAGLVGKLNNNDGVESMKKNIVESAAFRKGIGKDYLSMMVTNKKGKSELETYAKKALKLPLTDEKKPIMAQKTYAKARNNLY